MYQVLSILSYEKFRRADSAYSSVPRMQRIPLRVRRCFRCVQRVMVQLVPGIKR